MQELGPPPDGAWQGLSAADTLRGLLLHRKDQSKRAVQFKTDFKLSDALFYHVKVRALASRAEATAGDDWSALWAFANERKSPIGYRPFVDACLAAGKKLEARRYAAKIDDYDEKVEMLVQLGAFSDAAELALKQKDLRRLQSMAELSAELTPAAQDIIEKAIASLSKRR